MDRCPRCNNYITQYDMNRHYCKKCKKWWNAEQYFAEVHPYNKPLAHELESGAVADASEAQET